MRTSLPGVPSIKALDLKEYSRAASIESEDLGVSKVLERSKYKKIKIYRPC
jgi:hypothetical protein